jgi:RimJ/RimL family protein N-acetyltransferase
VGLVYDQHERVSDWVAVQMGFPPGSGSPVASAIGYERDNELVAAVLFENPTETNIFAHIAFCGEIFPLPLLAAVAKYVYVQMALRRMTFIVKDTNVACIRLIEKLGGCREARLRMGHKDGDLLLYVLWDTSRFYRKLIATGRIEVGNEFV